MDRKDDSNIVKIKKSFRTKTKQTSTLGESERREKVSSSLKESAKNHSFSPVYSKQYSNKIRLKANNEKAFNVYNKENIMDEIYQIIEEKIKESGYTRNVSGFEIYNEVSDLIEEKENGTYIFMSKPDDDVVFEYSVDIMSDNFNLSYIDINAPEGQYHIDFDK